MSPIRSERDGERAVRPGRRGAPSRASTSPTSRTTAPSTRARCASRSTGPRCATRSARTPSTSCTPRSTTPACRPTSAACCSPATARRPATAVWAFCSGGDQRIRGKDGYKYSGFRDRRRHRAGPGRPAPHPRGAAADPVHAQGRDLRRPRVGGRWRAQPARRVRPHAGQRRARPLQADRRRRRQLRRRLRLGLPGPPGRPEVRPRDLLPRARVLGRRLPPDGRRQRGRAPRRRWRPRRWSGRRRSTPRARPRSGC